MQTFLPYSDITKCAKVLDWRRLGKQRVEGMQILKALADPESSRWRFHPAVKMWEGYEDCLKVYVNAMIKEWVHRGYNNNIPWYTLPYIAKIEQPPWWGLGRIHGVHRQNLVRKDPEYYGQYWPNLEPREGYEWPYNRVDGQWVQNF